MLATKLSLISRILLTCDVFPGQWRRAVITPIPKGPLSSLVSGYRPISLTSILSKIYVRLVSTRLYCFMEGSVLFGFSPFISSPTRRLWDCNTCDALLDIVCTDQSELDGGRELALFCAVGF